MNVTDLAVSIRRKQPRPDGFLPPRRAAGELLQEMEDFLARNCLQAMAALCRNLLRDERIRTALSAPRRQIHPPRLRRGAPGAHLAIMRICKAMSALPQVDREVLSWGPVPRSGQGLRTVPRHQPRVHGRRTPAGPHPDRPGSPGALPSQGQGPARGDGLHLKHLVISHHGEWSSNRPAVPDG